MSCEVCNDNKVLAFQGSYVVCADCSDEITNEEYKEAVLKLENKKEFE